MFQLKKFVSANLKDKILYLKDFILNKPNLKNGFIEETPAQTQARGDYELGAIPKMILRPDAQWDGFASQGERQEQGGDQDKMACVTFSAHNTIETMVNFFLSEEKGGNTSYTDILNVFRAFSLIKDGEANFSDRYTAKMSGTSLRGNSLQVVANSIRHNGLVPEDKWPYVNDWNEYYKTIGSDIIKLGQLFTEYIDIAYEWVDQSQFNDTKKYAPLQTSVCADGSWFGDGVIPRNNGALNHAVMNNGFVYTQYDKIGDSYEPFQKKVAWDFNLGNGLIFTITLKKKFSNQEEVNRWLAKGYQFIMFPLMHGELYQLSSNGLHKVSAQEWNDAYVLEMQAEKKLVLLPNDEYAKLVN
jgi:hypothetical protein